MSLSRPQPSRDESEDWQAYLESVKAWDQTRDDWVPSLGYKTLDKRPSNWAGIPERVTFVERCRACRKVAARYTVPDDLREGGWQLRPACGCEEPPTVVLPAGRALERRVARARAGTD